LYDDEGAWDDEWVSEKLSEDNQGAMLTFGNFQLTDFSAIFCRLLNSNF
jgi:hypothetical protein